MTNDKNGILLGGTARSPQDVQRLHDLGLRLAEIPITRPDEFSGLLEIYKALKDKLGISYLCHGPREGDPNDMSSLESEYLPKVLEILPLMTRLNMSLLTVHLWLDPRFVSQEVIRFKIQLLKRIIDAAKDGGIRVCLENLSENASDMAIPLKALPLLNLTLDLGHAQLLTEMNTSYGFIERFPTRIKHIHLHDNRGGHSYKSDLHLPPGEGIIQFDKIFEALIGTGYNRSVTLELKPHEIERCLEYVKDMLS